MKKITQDSNYPRFPAILRLHEETRARLQRHWRLPPQPMESSYALFCQGILAGAAQAQDVSSAEGADKTQAPSPPAMPPRALNGRALEPHYAQQIYAAGYRLGRMAYPAADTSDKSPRD